MCSGRQTFVTGESRVQCVRLPLADVERGARSNRNFRFEENRLLLKFIDDAGQQKIEYLYPPYPQ
jgi:hypothetical protein